MEHILSEIKSVPGVMGSYVYNSRSGILIKDMPDFFKRDKLEQASRHIVKVYSTGENSFDDITGVFFNYENATIYIKAIKNRYFLVVFSESSKNFKLFKMAVNSAVDDLLFALEKPEQVKEESVSKEEVFSAEKNEESIDLTPILTHMESSLAKVMGPIAKVVFIDSVDKWKEGSDPTLNNIDNLVKIIRSEINNTQKEEKYLQTISPYLNQK